MVPNSALVPDEFCTPSVAAFSGNSASFNGTVCGLQVQFLRMAWNGAVPLVRQCVVSKSSIPENVTELAIPLLS